MKDYKSTLRQALTTVIESPEFDASKVESFFSADYIQNVDGKRLNYKMFNQHVKTLKSLVRNINIQFINIVQENNVVFSNHLVTAMNKEGQTGQMKVIGEFRFNDQGLICYCDEVTHQVSGDVKSRYLGSRIHTAWL